MNKEKSNNESDYLDTIKKLRDDGEEQFDKLIVYLNSGALVLSIGFANDIVTITEATDTCILKVSWILFALSLIINLFSHKTSILSMAYEIIDEGKKSDVWDRITHFSNWSAFGLLILGIVLFVLFVLKTF